LDWSHPSRIPSWSVFECHYLHLVFIIVIRFSVQTAIVAGQQLLHLLEAKANACTLYDSKCTLAKKRPRNSRCWHWLKVWILTYCMHCLQHVASMCRATSKHTIQFASRITAHHKWDTNWTPGDQQKFDATNETTHSKKCPEKKVLGPLARQSLATQPSGSALAA